MMRLLLFTLVSGTVTGAVLTGLLLVLFRRTHRRFSAGWHRAALCVPLLFFILPAGLVARSALSALGRSIRGGHWENVFPEPLRDLPFVTAEAVPAAAQRPEIPISAILLAVWLTGALLILTRRMVQLHRFRAMLQSTNQPVRDTRVLAVWDRSRATLGVRPRLTLHLNASIGTPMLTGGGRGAMLILPSLDLSERELELIFRHELIHARRRDLWLKWAGMLLCCLHWFNPLAHLLDRRLGDWIELACDEAVVSGMNAAQRREYGFAILNVLGRAGTECQGICAALCENTNHMKERLSAMLSNRKPDKRSKLVSMILILLVAFSGMLVGAACQRQGIEPVAQEAGSGPVEEALPVTQPPTIEPVLAEPSAGASTEEPLEDADNAIRWENAQLIADMGLESGPTQLLWPVPSESGQRGSTYEGHTGMGLDISGDAGSEVVAAADAVVVTVVRDYTGYGHYAILDHGGGYQTLYAHCASIDVEVGDVVRAGERIAALGRTGWATGNHLHIEVRRAGQYVDPRQYMNGQNTPMDFPAL